MNRSQQIDTQIAEETPGGQSYSVKFHSTNRDGEAYLKPMNMSG